MDNPLDKLTIVRHPHPTLRQKAKPIKRVSPELEALADRMVILMKEVNGLGLAANQVGLDHRLAVIEIDEELTVLIDPKIIHSEGAEVADEGCLSFPRLYGAVERPAKVTVRARDLTGKTYTIEGVGLLARALCHELDHLEGKLFVDRAAPDSLYWLVGETSEGEPIIQPTTLDEALKVFAATLQR